MFLFSIDLDRIREQMMQGINILVVVRGVLRVDG